MPGSLPAISWARCLGRGGREVEPGSVWVPLGLFCPALPGDVRRKFPRPESEARETDGTSRATSWGSGQGGALSLHQGLRTPGAQPRLKAKQPRDPGQELLPWDVKDACPPQRPSRVVSARAPLRLWPGWVCVLKRAETPFLTSHSAASDHLCGFFTHLNCTFNVYHSMAFRNSQF